MLSIEFYQINWFIAQFEYSLSPELHHFRLIAQCFTIYHTMFAKLYLMFKTCMAFVCTVLNMLLSVIYRQFWAVTTLIA